MKNPWLGIKLDEYENHMSLPHIRQAGYLAGLFGSVLNKVKPSSAAIIGCAGGNGLDKINTSVVNRVVCVDINQEFLNLAEKRYGKEFSSCEFLCGDISDAAFGFEPVDLIFAALVLEYTDHEKAIENISRLLKRGGFFLSVLQLPSESIPEVSPSPYKSLGVLSDIFTFVSSESVKNTAAQNGLAIINENKTTLASGKSFYEMLLVKN